MAVELGASRLLAPYFSSAQIVWTIIIGTIMIAMALGNVFGGKWADKNPDPDRLYRRILIAAVWIGCIPVLGKYLVVLISGALVLVVNNGFLILAAFVSCFVIFVFPLFLLGTVTPGLVKATTDSLKDNARVVGRLGACDTIGSIIGTFAPTFLTIPAFGTSISFLITSGVLLALCLTYFISEFRTRQHLTAIIISVLVFALCCVTGWRSNFAFWERHLAYEGESIYNYLQVRDTKDSTILSTNVLFGVQSVTMKRPGLTGMYYDYALAAPAMAGVGQKESHADQNPNLLVLGMGTGTYARQCEHFYPSMHTTGVEIDRKITDLSYKYFGASRKAKTYTYAARAFLSADRTQTGRDRRYNVIMVDAYQDITIPFQMSSVEFFRLVRSHLKPGGVMVVNLNMRSADRSLRGRDINTHLSDTIATVFPHVYMVNVPDYTNRELFATDSPDALDHLSLVQSSHRGTALAGLLGRIRSQLVVYHSHHLPAMTDDKAPVELLGMREIDSIIREQLQYYKNIFRTQGLQGLLSAA